MKISNSKNLEKAKMNSSRAPPNYMTLSDVDQAIYSEELSLTINQVSALIKIDPPKTIWFFEIDQVCFETFFKRSFKSGTEINGEDVWNLFFINRIKFGLTSLPSGNIGKIKLKYYKSRQKFELSIQTASYNSSNKGEKPLFQSPVMDSVGAKQKYFVKMEASFQENLLNKINVNISPILLSISTHTLAEDLCSFALISKFSRQQKKTIPLMLATEVFEKTIFEGVQQSLIQSQHEQETFEISIRNDVSHFGSFAASNDISITVIAEGLKAHCIANSNGTVIFYFILFSF